MKAIEEPWIKKGYYFLAWDGPDSLKIERMAKEVGKNKASFYHLFGDLDCFTERLLDHHLEQAKLIARKESEAENEDALIDILLEHKIDLLFNRQLRFHREIPEFTRCFTEVDRLFFLPFISLWKDIIGLHKHGVLAEVVLTLSLDNFYLRITEKTLNRDWLKAYFKSIRQMVAKLQQTQDRKIVDGSV